LRCPLAVRLPDAGKIFLSPRLITQPDGQLSILLEHELLYLYFNQQISFRQFAGLPIWFNEGIATLISQSDGRFCDAKQDIRNGTSFIPSASGSLLFPEYHTAFGLSRGTDFAQILQHLIAWDKTKHGK